MDGGNSMTINGNILTADNGKVLKKGDVIAVTVHLGVNDNASNWTEIDKSDEEISDSEALEIITGGAT
jgi:hypothetical protein